MKIVFFAVRNGDGNATSDVAVVVERNYIEQVSEFRRAGNGYDL